MDFDGEGPHRLKFMAAPAGQAAGAPTEVSIQNLVIAGWAGRDEAAIEHHIKELEEIGIKRPRATPLFYRVAASLLTTSPTIQVAGGDSSGEAEAVVLKWKDTLWVGIGSDHTDRKVEAYGVTVSKQVCAKPVGSELWRFDDVAGHWDELVLESYVINGADKKIYQRGTLASLRNPLDLIERYEREGGAFANGTAMLCGTVPVIDGFKPSEQFEIQLQDPVRKRSLTHRYAITVLPIAD